MTVRIEKRLHSHSSLWAVFRRASVLFATNIRPLKVPEKFDKSNFPKLRHEYSWVTHMA